MEQIGSGSGSGELLTIDPVSLAARTTLYGANGVEVSRRTLDVFSTNDRVLPIAGLNDGQVRPIRLDRFSGQAVALNNLLFTEAFTSATLATHRWNIATTTFTQATTLASGVNMNSGAVTTAAAAVLLSSVKRIYKAQRSPLQFKARARLGHIANAQMELGFGTPASQTVAPTVGAYFQVTTGGQVQGVFTFNGTDVTASITLPSGWQSNFYVWDILIDDDSVTYIVQNSATSFVEAEVTIVLPVTQSKHFDNSHLGVYARLHNVTAPATAPSMLVSQIDVISLDNFINKPYSHSQATNGFGCETNPNTMAQITTFANSAAPASATLSNTAAGYNTLGGLFQFVAVGGAATDYALFGFTVPAPFTFVCTGVDIDVWNTVVAVATTPTLLTWFASPDQTAISLATATNRRVTLGAQVFPVGAAVGAMADRRVSSDFSHGPLVTNAGRIFVIGLRMPVATATATEIFQGMVTVKGYFE